MPVGPFSQAPDQVARRRMKPGHILRRPQLLDGFDNLWVIRCEGEGCGWIGMPHDLNDHEQKQRAEIQAHEHRTEPTLLIAGSSDILPAMRQQQVLEELVADAKRRR